MLQEKTKMVSLPIFPSKTNGFSRQQHVAPLKLRHVAAQFFLIFFYLRLKKKKKNYRSGWVSLWATWGWPNHLYGPCRPPPRAKIGVAETTPIWLGGDSITPIWPGGSSAIPNGQNLCRTATPSQMGVVQPSLQLFLIFFKALK